MKQTVGQHKAVISRLSSFSPTILLHQYFEGDESEHEGTCFRIPTPTTQMTSGETLLSRKTGQLMNIFLCWEGLVGKSSFSGSRNLRLERTIAFMGRTSTWPLRLCVWGFILAQALQALCTALARYDFGESKHLGTYLYLWFTKQSV